MQPTKHTEPTAPKAPRNGTAASGPTPEAPDGTAPTPTGEANSTGRATDDRTFGQAEPPADFDPLKLSNQLCFPLYATSRAITKRYTPLLKKLDLTYTQYLVMMVLWEHRQTTVRDLGDQLYLDSGTLTPLLKKMEAKDLLTRRRDTTDERKVVVTITDKGQRLRDEALSIPETIWHCVNIPASDAAELKRLLAEVMGNLNAEGK